MAVNYSLLQISTFGLALLGSVLGVINTWKALDHDKVKLKVIPKNAIPVGALENCGVDFCIEVINKSTFAITITEIGFLLKGLKERAAIYQPIIIDKGPFPRTLESRSSFTGYILKNSIAKIPKCAYAHTSCGVQRTGTSPALRQMAKKIGNIKENART